MIIPRLVLSLISLQILLFFHPSFSQNLEVEGSASIGSPGEGNTLLNLVSERSWGFRQFGTGANTALELACFSVNKNFAINTTGRVGIGTLLPEKTLHVVGDIKIGDKIDFGSAEFFKDGGVLTISCNGGLQSVEDGADNLGSSSKRWNDIFATSGVVNTSDARVKSNMQDMTYGLNDIMQLHPVSFNWKDHPDEGAKLGLIAQEVQTIIPEVVVDHDQVRDEITGAITKIPAQQLGIYYSDLIPVLIKGIQQQQQIIHDSNERISVLEIKAEKVDELEKRLVYLEARLAQPANTISTQQ